MKIIHLIILFFVFNALLAIPPLVSGYVAPAENILIPHFWSLFGLFSLLTFFILLVAFWRMSISNRSSGQALLGSITVKLLFCMVLVFIYLSENRVDPGKFMLNFFYLYLFHTGFEIYCLLRNLRNQNFK